MDSAGLPFCVVNDGIDGLTTRDAVRTIGGQLREPAAVVVLELGANDALEGVPPEEVRRNLQAVIDTVRRGEPAAPIVLAGLKAPPHFRIEHAVQYQALFEKLARRNDTALIRSLLGGVLGNPQLTQPGGLHPNARGEVIVAEHVWSVLEGILRMEASRMQREQALIHSNDTRKRRQHMVLQAMSGCHTH